MLARGYFGSKVVGRSWFVLRFKGVGLRWFRIGIGSLILVFSIRSRTKGIVSLCPSLSFNLLHLITTRFFYKL